MSNLTIKDKLPIGVEVDGKRYRDFTMRPATLADACAAVNAAPADAPDNVLRYARMAQRVSFEGLPQEKVTLDLLMGMFERDAVALEAASDAIEKKLDELSSS